MLRYDSVITFARANPIRHLQVWFHLGDIPRQGLQCVFPYTSDPDSVALWMNTNVARFTLEIVDP